MALAQKVISLPEPLLRCNTLNFSLEHLHNRVEGHDKTAPWLLGYRIPPFQRPLVWEPAQMDRFIESAWLGLHLGTYVVNKLEFVSDDRAHPYDRYLIDGLQRLNALSNYWNNQFPVFGYYWNDIPEQKRRTFLNVQFACSRTVIKKEAVLRELYNRLNFGGTAHTAEQRA